MTERTNDDPTEVDEVPEHPPTVRVPTRLGDGLFTENDYADVDPDAAGQWDARQWHNRPIR